MARGSRRAGALRSSKRKLPLITSRSLHGTRACRAPTVGTQQWTKHKDALPSRAYIRTDAPAPCGYERLTKRRHHTLPSVPLHTCLLVLLLTHPSIPSSHQHPMLNTNLGSGTELEGWGLQPLQTEGLRSDNLLSGKGAEVGICPGATQAPCCCLDHALVAGRYCWSLGKGVKPLSHSQRPWGLGNEAEVAGALLAVMLSLEDVLMCWRSSV